MIWDALVAIIILSLTLTILMQHSTTNLSHEEYSELETLELLEITEGILCDEKMFNELVNSKALNLIVNMSKYGDFRSSRLCLYAKLIEEK